MPKPIIQPLLGGGLRLRPLSFEDLPLTLRWRNRDDVRRWFIHSAPLTWEQHSSWFQKYLDASDDVVWIVEDVACGSGPVGQASLYHIDRASGSAEFGRFLIGEPAARGRGFGLEAAAAVLRGGFQEWGLKTIYLEVFAGNERAIRLYRDCGFAPVSTRDDLVRMELNACDFHQSNYFQKPPRERSA